MRVNLFNVVRFLIIVAVFNICLFSDSYTFIYFGIVSMLLLAVMSLSLKMNQLFLLALAVFLGIGLLNISSYRNYISVDTIRIYSVAVGCLVFPLVLLKRKMRDNMPQFHSTPLLRMVVVGHLSICWVFLLYVYATKGVVVIQQDLRFGIPTAIGYAIRSCQFIPVYLLCLQRSDPLRKHIIAFTFLSVLPTILIASRSTAFLVFFSLFIYLQSAGTFNSHLERYSNKIKDKGYFGSFLAYGLIVFVAFVLIAGGFYLRRAGTDELMGGIIFVRTFMADYPLWVSVPLAPFHQGFNEAAALTSRIVDNGYYNSFTSTPLLFADFDNLFGRSSISAAQYFGAFVGKAQAAGLTPGLVGGVLLDYSSIYPLIFLIFGVLLAVSSFYASISLRGAVFHSILLGQFLHLFLRGFIKPEYITILLIAIFYISFMRAEQSGPTRL